MGASACGKDSLLAAFSQLEQKKNTVIMRRYITRPASAIGETHIAVTQNQFTKLAASNAFCMQWHSHGLFYGISANLHRLLQNDQQVLVNGSRNYLPQALQQFPHLLPICITIDPEVRKERLRARGRETGNDLKERLADMSNCQNFPPQTIFIDNSYSLEQSLRQLIKVLCKKNSLSTI